MTYRPKIFRLDDMKSREYVTETYPGIRLGDVLPAFAGQLEAALFSISEDVIASQVERLFVPTQKLAGQPEQFSCLAYPIPRPTLNERERLPIREPRTIVVSIGSAQVTVCADEFNLINWIQMAGVPDLHQDLAAGLESLHSEAE